MQLAVQTPDGTRYNFDVGSAPSRGDMFYMVGKGTGRVETVMWVVEPGDQQVKRVEVSLVDWVSFEFD